VDVLARRVGKDLARVQDPVPIKRPLHALHGIEIVRAENPGHERALLEPDPMLTRQRAAELHDRAKHLLARALDLAQDLAITKVEKDVGMEVAVARVKHVGDRKLVVLANLAYGGEDLGQA
jgi:hypothetical protein